MTELHDVADNILTLMNRVLDTDDDQEVLQSVAHIKENLRHIQVLDVELVDETPSMILQRAVYRDPEIAARLKQLEDINIELASQLRTVSLTMPTAKLDEKGAAYYAMEEFMARLQVKMGRTYGWRVDYVSASSAPDRRPVKSEDIQKWQRTRRVPHWAFEQIEQLEFSKRQGQGGPPWTTQEYDFLEALYTADPLTPNAVLAEKCSKQFGRPITENSIKGALDRLRDKGRITMYRPSKKA